MKIQLSLLFTFFIVLTGISQSKILLKNGFLHVGNGETMQSALIGIDNGKISLIKNSLAYTINRDEWDTIIELNGRHIYPGFVAPNSTLGLTEIDAVRATRDFDEVGIYNPHVRSQIAYNVESDVMATVRTNGVLIVQATPRGGTISGTSSLMATSGWNWEDATIKGSDGIHLNWPSSIERDKKNHGVKKGNESYEDKKQEIYTFFEASKAYSNEKNAKTDLRFEAMRSVFKNDARVYCHANDLQQLEDALDFAKHFDLKHFVIIGGYESHLLIPKLKDAKVPVMIPRPHSLPENDDDAIDHPYRLASLLQNGGVEFCIQNEGDMEAMNARNIPFLAGTCLAYGLTEEEAIASITLNPCKIMGIDKYYGSIEVGKSATLFVSDGNALDMISNNIFTALIDGLIIPTTNRQSDLYERYSEKLNK